MHYRRGQFQVLAALVLALVLVVSRFAVVHDYTGIVRDSNADVLTVNGQVQRAVLASLAAATNLASGKGLGQQDATRDFTQLLGGLLMNVSEANYGFLFTLSSASASMSWNQGSFSNSGSSMGQATVNVTSPKLHTSWLEILSYTLTLSVQANNAASSQPLPGLLTVTVPVNFTLNGQAASWFNGTVQYQGQSYVVTVLQNYGNGVLLTQFSVPYTGSGKYHFVLTAWEANDIEVKAAFDVTAK